MALKRKAKVVGNRVVSGSGRKRKVELGQPLYGDEIVKTGKPTVMPERTGERTWNCTPHKDADGNMSVYHQSCSGNVIVRFVAGKKKGEIKKRIQCDCTCGHVDITKESENERA